MSYIIIMSSVIIVMQFFMFYLLKTVFKVDADPTVTEI
jgi:hypothetical protein